MRWKKWLENWDMTSLKINAHFVELEWKPKDEDKSAAWELYIELLTRITTQPLPPEDGVEKTALDSVYSLFPLTREIIKRHGRDCAEFTKLAIVVLNQTVRPFTARWHRLSQQGAFKKPAQCQAFRKELATLQTQLTRYTQMLGAMAGNARNNGWSGRLDEAGKRRLRMQSALLPLVGISRVSKEVLP